MLLVTCSAAGASPGLFADPDIGLIQDARFSPNGAVLAVMGDSGLVVLETDELRQVSIRQGRDVSGWRPVYSFSDDSGALAVVDAAAEMIWLLDLTSYVWQQLPLTEPRVTALAFSQDGKRLATGNDRGRIVLWDLVHMTEVLQLRSEAVRALSFVRNDSMLASGDGFRAVRIWHLGSLTEVFLGRHNGNVTALLRHPTLPLLVSTADDATTRLWSLDPLDSLATLQTLGLYGGKPQFSLDGHRLTFEDNSSSYSGASVWQLSPVRRLADVEGARLSLLGFGPNSRDLFTYRNAIFGQGGLNDLDVVQRHVGDDYSVVDTLILDQRDHGFLRLDYSARRSAMAYAYSEGPVHLVELGDPWERVIPDTTTSPASLSLGPSRPNPFTGATIIEFSLDVQTEFQLSVYDIAGQLIRSLADGTGAPGRHIAPWDGLDGQGRQVSSGVYFCQLRTNQTSSALKMVLVR